MNRRPERPLARWFVVTLIVILTVAFVVMVLVAIVAPTQEVLTGLATVVIPAALAGAEAARRYIKRRRHRP